MYYDSSGHSLIALLRTLVKTAAVVTEFAITTFSALTTTAFLFDCMHASLVGTVLLLEKVYKKYEDKINPFFQKLSDFLSKDPDATMNMIEELEPSDKVALSSNISSSSTMGGPMKIDFEKFYLEGDGEIDLLYKI